jgi:nucleoside-diphosphate-sugar epimerase
MIERNVTRAVVTGPTGAIGTALCRRLARQGVTVYAVCRPDSPRVAALPKHEQIIPVACDVRELSKLEQLIPQGADAFYHLAWAHTIGPGRNDMSAQIENIQYTIDAVHTAAALGCRVFVGAGSQAEYGRVEGMLRPETPCFPENGYGMAKLCAGQMSRAECRRLGVEHIWARILSVYGPGDGAATMISGVIRQLKAGQKPALTAGEQQWDYLYSEDAADALCRMAFHGVDQKIYPLGSGRAAPLKEYIKTLRDAIDPALPLGLGEIPYSSQQVMHLQADISALTADTGFVPETPFAVGIRKTIEYSERNV